MSSATLVLRLLIFTIITERNEVWRAVTDPVEFEQDTRLCGGVAEVAVVSAVTAAQHRPVDAAHVLCTARCTRPTATRRRRAVIAYRPRTFVL